MMVESEDEILLLPQDPVKDLMNELIEKDIIPFQEILRMKNDFVRPTDPNIIMDLRHEQIKERRKSHPNRKEANEQVNNPKSKSKTKIKIATDQMKEMIYIDDEIKKCQKEFEIKNRKMGKMIADIKQSGREVNHKMKKLRLKHERQKDTNDNQTVLIKNINSLKLTEISNETQNNEQLNTTISQSVTIQTQTNETLKKLSRSMNIEKNIESLNEIKCFLDSLDDLEEGDISEHLKRNNNIESSFEHYENEHEKVNDTNKRTNCVNIKENQNEETGIINITERESVNDTIEQHFSEVELINEGKFVNFEDINKNNDYHFSKMQDAEKHICKIEKGKNASGENDIAQNSNSEEKDRNGRKGKNQIKREIEKLPTTYEKKVRERARNENEGKLVANPVSDKLCDELPKRNTIEEMKDLILEINKNTVKNEEQVSATCANKIVNEAEIKNPLNDDDDVVTAGDTYNPDVKCFDKEKFLMKKFWKKWTMRLTKSNNAKITENESTIRNTVDMKFDLFLSNLQKHIKDKKNENEPNRNNELKGKDTEKNIICREKFKNRFRAQKEIIEKQRLVLEEQRKKIKQLEDEEETKINKRKSKSSVVNVNKDVEEDKTPLKTKCRTRKEKMSSSEVPKFVENMNKRAEERKEKWEQLRELKLKKEEEKMQIKIKEEEDKRKKREEKKYEEMKAEQMEYLRKILLEEDRKRELQNIQEAERRISALNREILLTRYMDLWKKILTKKKELLKRADDIYTINLKKKSFQSLLEYAKSSKKEKLEMALLFKRCQLQKKYWNIWHQSWKERVQMSQVAEDYNDMRIKRRILISFLWNKEQNKKMDYQLLLEAIQYHKRKLLSKAFQSLKVFPKTMYEEREKEKRLRSWEEKVKEILPDFSIS